MFKLIIAGGRDFNHPNMLFDETRIYLDELYTQIGDKVLDLEIVSGRANGADKWGETFADEHYFPKQYFPANWDKHGKAAGPIRNKEMAEYADAAIIFWDGKSRGSKNMIDNMKALNKPYKVINYG